MPAVALPVESKSIVGTELTAYAAAADGNTFVNDGQTSIIVFNDSGGALTFDVVTTQVIETTLAVADRSYSLDDGTYNLIGIFNISVYSATVTIQNYSTTTGVTIFVFK
jgi:hypothetical protein